MPLRSWNEQFPNVYALPVSEVVGRGNRRADANWVLIEQRFINQTAGFADLGALHALGEFTLPLREWAVDTDADYAAAGIGSSSRRPAAPISRLLRTRSASPTFRIVSIRNGHRPSSCSTSLPVRCS